MPTGLIKIVQGHAQLRCQSGYSASQLWSDLNLISPKGEQDAQISSRT